MAMGKGPITMRKRSRGVVIVTGFHSNFRGRLLVSDKGRLHNEAQHLCLEFIPLCDALYGAWNMEQRGLIYLMELNQDSGQWSRM